MRTALHILLASTLSLIAGTATAAVHSVTASLDSVYILMGKQTALKVEIVEDVNTDGTLLRGDTLIKEVEVIADIPGDTVDLGNNRRQVTRNLIIQSFDSGLYTLPPLPYVTGGDTTYSSPLTLKVVPVDVDSLSTIHDFAGAVDVDSKWYDWIPDWITDYWAWYLLALVLIAGGVVAYLMLTGKAKVLPQKKPVPPYIFALNALNALRERHLCEQGQEREFYTELTDILREYLERRFGINAMEMTSSQILSTLQSREETRMPKAHMQQILEIADFVKFAKMRPLPDDNVKAFNSAMRFVEDTKPVENPDDDTLPNDQRPTTKQ